MNHESTILEDYERWKWRVPVRGSIARTVERINSQYQMQIYLTRSTNYGHSPGKISPFKVCQNLVDVLCIVSVYLDTKIPANNSCTYSGILRHFCQYLPSSIRHRLLSELVTQRVASLGSLIFQRVEQRTVHKVLRYQQYVNTSV